MKKSKTAKILAFCMLCTVTYSALSGQVSISPNFRAANFWMPGNGNGLNLSQNFNGDLQLYIGQMKTLGVTHFRIGGKSIDQGNMFNFNDLADAINWLRSHGFELPVV